MTSIDRLNEDIKINIGYRIERVRYVIQERKIDTKRKVLSIGAMKENVNHFLFGTKVIGYEKGKVLMVTFLFYS